jgi:hypothetical protein
MQRILLMMLIPFLGFSPHSIAQGDLLISPKRIVFDGNRQKEELNLVNTGKDTATYSISFLQYNMNEDGSILIIEKPDSGQMFADPFLRIFPRKVTLAPGEPQVISLQCRRKPDMLAGEYRSHLYFRSEKNYSPLGMKNSTKDSTLFSVQLIPIYGMSIPIIIRSGEVEVSAELSYLNLKVQQDTAAFLEVTINRKGNISIYGNLIVDYVPAQGKTYTIGTVKGIGVYTNIKRRNVSIKLNKSPGINLKTGKLKVRYTSSDESKYEVYAESEMELKNEN